MFIKIFHLVFTEKLPKQIDGKKIATVIKVCIEFHIDGECSIFKVKFHYVIINFTVLRNKLLPRKL